MKSPLNILHLEDDMDDAALVQGALDEGDISTTTTCVQKRTDFMNALGGGKIDLVIADYSLPQFDGMSALKIVRAQWPDLPFILVSGTVGEELAIDSMKGGATDYVLKDRLSRLAPAVRRAMLEVEASAEKKSLEAQFIEAQKMEVIGQLAGGVAHDFNNILAVIIGYGDLMMRQLEPGSPLKGFAEHIQHAAERATGLTRQLLVFSRKQTVQLTVLNLNPIVKDTEQMLRRLIDEDIELVVILEGERGWLKADAGYMGQVLMNLVVNARDAMPNGGQLTIASSNVIMGPESEKGIPGMAGGSYVLLSVRDTGTGMTDEVKAHLFEPFFTTKHAGKGTGLGLATCQTIVKQCGGHIEVSSELGKGSNFKVYFPRVDQPPVKAAEPVDGNLLARGSETLLLVEDEPSLRHLARSVLEAQGYEVLSAANGNEGLNVAREHRGSLIRLVVTDVVMPQMNGKVMAEWLKITFPDLKILFTSGYTDDAIVHRGMMDPGVAFLPKPYTPATLTRKIREMLDDKVPAQTVALSR